MYGQKILIIKMNKIKYCEICHQGRTKPQKWSWASWNNSRFCSRKCSGVAMIGRVYSDERNKKVALGKIGAKNPAWKGGISNPTARVSKNINLTKTEYNTLHEWIRKNKPLTDRCEDCEKQSNDLDAANISKKYLKDINDFKWLCSKCHYKFDEKVALPNFYYSRKGKKNGLNQKAAARQGQLLRWERWRQQQI